MIYMGATSRQIAVLIGTFIGALVGLILLPEVNTLCTDVAANVSGITKTVVEFLPTFYALLLLGMMAGALWKLFR